MANPPDLRQRMKAHDNRTAPVVESPLPVPAQLAEQPRNPHYRPSREGMENLTGYFPPAVKHQLMEICIDRRRQTSGKVTIQDLLGEAINDLFAKCGKPEIVPLARKEGRG